MLSITQDYVKSLLRYDSEQGKLYWKSREDATSQWNNRCAGKEAGWDSGKYLKIQLPSGRYAAHRLIWMYMTGNWPEQEVDHIDRNHLNNMWSNLRLATSQQNSFNRRSKNTLGFKGVTKVGNRFQARISINGKSRSLGYYNSKEEAHAAYCKTAKIIHGEFNCTEVV